MDGTTRNSEPNASILQQWLRRSRKIFRGKNATSNVTETKKISYSRSNYRKNSTRERLQHDCSRIVVQVVLTEAPRKLENIFDKYFPSHVTETNKISYRCAIIARKRSVQHPKRWESIGNSGDIDCRPSFKSSRTSVRNKC